MREILFRGKAANRIDGRAYRTTYKNGDWVYGLLTDAENYAGFSEMTNTNGISGIEVDKNTVGQYTGLTDKNGKKIFEGDILRYYDDEIQVVEWSGVLSQVMLHTYGNRECKQGRKTFMEITEGWSYLDDYPLRDMLIIGNIHDNPELLEVTG